jgi:hypothetical protein
MVARHLLRPMGGVVLFASVLAASTSLSSSTVASAGSPALSSPGRLELPDVPLGQCLEHAGGEPPGLNGPGRLLLLPLSGHVEGLVSRIPPVGFPDVENRVSCRWSRRWLTCEQLGTGS